MRKNLPLHYAWVIVAVTFLATIMIAGVRATPTVLIVPLEHEFHWSRAAISLAIGINLLLYGAVGPFAAAVMDRFGARRTISLALAVTAAAVALTPAMSEAWHLVALWGVVVGLATGFVGAYLAAFIAARWFATREGLVVGILTAGYAAGQLVFLSTMAALASNARRSPSTKSRLPSACKKPVLAARRRLGGGDLLRFGFARRGAESEPDPIISPIPPIFDRVRQRDGSVGNHLQKCNPLLRG
jgi:MFS family permease